MKELFGVAIFEVMEQFKIKELPQLGEFHVNLMEWPATVKSAIALTRSGLWCEYQGALPRQQHFLAINSELVAKRLRAYNLCSSEYHDYLMSILLEAAIHEMAHVCTYQESVMKDVDIESDPHGPSWQSWMRFMGIILPNSKNQAILAINKDLFWSEYIDQDVWVNLTARMHKYF